MGDREWELNAHWWRDGFTEGADPEYTEQLIPLLVEHTGAGSLVVDVGCGEGQVARALASGRGCEVIGVDRSPAQLRTAMQRGGPPTYALGDAGALPLGSAVADVAVACLLLEHTEDLDAVLGEAARVLRPGGRLLVLINHPIVQTPGSGWVDDHIVDPPEQYWQLGWYLDTTTTVEEVDPGVFITFHHRTLAEYLNCARGHGLVLGHMEEPAPPPGFIAKAPEYTEQARMPRVMFMRLERLS